MDAWEVAKRILKQQPVTSTQLEILKTTLGYANREIRYADSSDNKDLIVFEVKHRDGDNGQIIVSIAPDNIPESYVMPFDEVMKDIVTEWI